MQKTSVYSTYASAGATWIALALALGLVALTGCSDQSKPETPKAAQPAAPQPAAPKTDRAGAEAQAKLTALRFERDKDPTAARTGYAQAIALDPACPLPYLQLGHLADAEEKWDEALTNFAQFVKLDAVSDDSIKTQLRMDELKKLAEQDKTPEGKRARLYEAALARIGNANSQGHLDDAIKEAAAAVQIDPQRFEGYVQQASALAKQHQFADAQPLLKKALELVADDKKATIQAALDQCNTEIQGAALVKAASDALETKDYILAQTKYAEAFTLLPAHESWGLSAALAALQAEDYYGGKELLQKLTAAQDATVAEQARNRLAKVEDLLAERDAQGADLRSKAESSDDLMKLGWKFEHGTEVPKDVHQAFICYQLAMQNAKWSDDRSKMKAMLFMEQVYHAGRGTPKDASKANECFQEAAKIVQGNNSNDAKGKYSMACFYAIRSGFWPNDTEGTVAAQKNKEEALKQLNEAVDLGYRDYEHMGSNADFDQIKKDSDFKAVVQRVKDLVIEKQQKEDAQKEKARLAELQEKQAAEAKRNQALRDVFNRRPRLMYYWSNDIDKTIYDISTTEDSATVTTQDYEKAGHFFHIGNYEPGAVSSHTFKFADLNGIHIRLFSAADGGMLSFSDNGNWVAVRGSCDDIKSFYDDLVRLGIKTSE